MPLAPHSLLNDLHEHQLEVSQEASQDGGKEAGSVALKVGLSVVGLLIVCLELLPVFCSVENVREWFL